MTFSPFLIVYGFALLCCAQGWTYHYSPDNMKYDDAYKYCTEKYTSMVAIQNQNENEYLNNILPSKKENYWIGIRKNKNTGNWTWVGTNSILTKEAENWATNQPNNLSDSKDEDCVEMYVKQTYNSGQWNAEPCSKQKAALCYTVSCHPSSCNNHGECVETINNYTCNCYDGYHGEKCEQVVVCPEINSTDHKSMMMTCCNLNGKFAYLSNCHFNCSDGYVLVGSENLSCTKEGEWGAPIPHCKGIHCKRPAVPLNGMIRCTNDEEILPDKSMCNISCNDGFSLVGSTSVLCLTPGQWTDEPPKCNAIQCKRPKKNENGVMDCSDNEEMLPYKSRCNFRCNEGFTLIGSPSITCMTPYQWTEKPAKCDAIQCKRPKKNENGVMDCSDNEEMLPYKSRCNFRCNEGFTLIGSPSITCMTPYQWTEKPAKCEAIQCHHPEIPKNGAMQCSSNEEILLKSSCNFTCNKGFTLVGSNKTMCMAPDQWTKESPICQAIQCHHPEILKNGTTQCSSNEGILHLKSSCNFTCNKGFTLVGSNKTMCIGPDQWTKPPTCQAVKCKAIMDPSGGKMNCTHVSGEFKYGSVCTFDCWYCLSLKGNSTVKCESNGRWSTEPPTCKVAIIYWYLVGALIISVLFGVALWYTKRSCQTANNSTPQYSYHRLMDDSEN